MNSVLRLTVSLILIGGIYTANAQSMTGSFDLQQARASLLTALERAANQATQTWQQQFNGQPIASNASAFALRTEINLGQPQASLDLAPCQRIEPFLPGQTRAWGKFQLGVRCVEGTRWQIYIPAEVKIYAPILVASRNLGLGESLGELDIREETIEVTQFSPNIARSFLSSLQNHTDYILVRPMAMGQPIRVDLLRPRPVIGAGDLVKVILTGQGFSINTNGKALQSAGIGQTVRVQMENGKVLTGTARESQDIEVKL